MASIEETGGPMTPFGLNHLVIHVRDIEESHRFWTEMLGFQQVGEFKSQSGGVPQRGTMRFYSGDRGGKLHHHDIALVENPALPPAGDSRPSAKVNVRHGRSAVPGSHPRHAGQNPGRLAGRMILAAESA